MKEFEYRLITNLIIVRNIRREIRELTYDDKYLYQADMVGLNNEVNKLERRVEKTIATNLNVEPEILPEIASQEISDNHIKVEENRAKPQFGGGDGVDPNE